MPPMSRAQAKEHFKEMFRTLRQREREKHPDIVLSPELERLLEAFSDSAAEAMSRTVNG